VEEEELEDGPCILIENQNIYNSLEVDKNNNPILPVARYMWNGIENKRLIPDDAVVNDEADEEAPNDEQLVPVKDICRGYLSAAAERFDDENCLAGSMLLPASRPSSRPSSRPDSRSDGMNDDEQARTAEDDYELSSQDSDDDIMIAPFPHLSKLRKSPSKPLPISPPTLSSLMPKIKRNETVSPVDADSPSLAPPILNSPRGLTFPVQTATSPQRDSRRVAYPMIPAPSLSPPFKSPAASGSFPPFTASQPDAIRSTTGGISFTQQVTETPFSIR
jgi:hypothetical protein